MTPAILSVTHPTDFSELSMNAFVHALRISVGAGDPWRRRPAALV
jgi:hypothetical protein